MKTFRLQNKRVLIIGFPIVVVLSMIFFVRSQLFLQHASQLSIPVALDLILTIPLVHLVLIRKTKISKLTVFSLIVFGTLIASLILPKEEQGFLEIIQNFGIPILEIGVISYIIFKVVRIIRVFKKNGDKSLDFYSAVQIATQETFPSKIATLLATEIAVVYYSFFCWKKLTYLENEFSYHKKGGAAIVLATFIFIILIETFAVHILLEMWNPLVAWILLGISVYTCFQIYEQIRAAKYRPIIVNKLDDEILLRDGIFANAVIKISEIEKVEQTAKSIPEKSNIIKLGLAGPLASHNLIISLKSENELIGIYGMKKKFRGIAIFVDEKENFLACISEATNFDH